ncbi:uncharacterized protein LOC144755038 isoform X1 [Lissotriton helveticus]
MSSLLAIARYYHHHSEFALGTYAIRIWKIERGSSLFFIYSEAPKGEESTWAIICHHHQHWHVDQPPPPATEDGSAGTCTKTTSAALTSASQPVRDFEEGPVGRTWRRSVGTPQVLPDLLVELSRGNDVNNLHRSPPYMIKMNIQTQATMEPGEGAYSCRERTSSEKIRCWMENQPSGNSRQASRQELRDLVIWQKRAGKQPTLETAGALDGRQMLEKKTGAEG